MRWSYSSSSYITKNYQSVQQEQRLMICSHMSWLQSEKAKWAGLCNNWMLYTFHNVKIPRSEEVTKKTVTSRPNCPLCSCAQTVTVSPSVTKYSGWVSPTMTSVVVCILWYTLSWSGCILYYMNIIFQILPSILLAVLKNKKKTYINVLYDILYALYANQKDQLIEPNLIKKTLQVVAHKGSS